METQEEIYSSEEEDIQYDKHSDYGNELASRGTNWNLRHLTISDEALDWFKDDDYLYDFIPLIDQICNTNKLDERGIELYRCMITSMVAEKILWTDEDDQQGFDKLNTARIYLFSLLDGTKDGYRGKLATELKRVYKKQEQEKKKRRFF